MDMHPLLPLQGQHVPDSVDEIEQSVAQERQRLARELHDSVSQAFYGINLCARNAREALDADPHQAIAPLEHVIRFAEQGMAELQALLFNLRADALQTDGLIVALSKQIALLRACYGLNIDVLLGTEPALALEIKHALYRIAQEALHNIAKHANAGSIIVQLTVNEQESMLEVRDNGKGFDPARQSPGCFGLRSMQERAASLNGTFTLESAPGQGTCIQVHIPCGATDNLLIVGKAAS
ncbi:MAG TPA: sensor histidine kinase [Ktedonosporobacter sp.]|nr:sensor histidine kinase [Ktedonosporobacter sp.]